MSISLIDELKRQDVEVSAAGTESDVEGLLRQQCTGRCIVYLSPHSTADRDFCKSSVLSVASLRGRDAVVVVLDEALETPPDEWKDFLCLRYDTQRLSDLCRQLALLIQTPILSCRPQYISGYAAAFRVFYGYLQFAVPNFRERLKEVLYPDVYRSCVKKSLIIFPESCCCPTVMEKEGYIWHADKFVPRTMARGGQTHRDLSASIYCIRDEERNRDYYCAIEFDNCLGTMRDIQRSGVIDFDETRMHKKRNNYFLYLKQLLKHSPRYDTEQCRLLYWRNGEKSDVISLHQFLLPVVREILENESEETVGSPIDFECRDSKGANPGSLYVNPAECYKLDSQPKGICLIINIAEFDDSQELPPRDGSEADARQLADVFQWLGFKIKAYSNKINKSKFHRIINKVWELDHKAYDAFVCCIMSHGYLGHILTADGQSVPILQDIAEEFYSDSCPTLKGKPKIFLIQSCQTTKKHVSDATQRTADEGRFSACETAAHESDAGTLTSEARKRSLLQPNAPDFFMCYSALPSSPSYRDRHNGTYYIQSLVEELKEGRKLQDTLYRVAQRVEKNAPGQQRPFQCVSTDHKFVFLCGKLFCF